MDVRKSRSVNLDDGMFSRISDLMRKEVRDMPILKMSLEEIQIDHENKITVRERANMKGGPIRKEIQEPDVFDILVALDEKGERAALLLLHELLHQGRISLTARLDSVLKVVEQTAARHQEMYTKEAIEALEDETED